MESMNWPYAHIHLIMVFMIAFKYFSDLITGQREEYEDLTFRLNGSVQI